MVLSRVLGAISLGIVAIALVSVITSWSDDDDPAGQPISAAASSDSSLPSVTPGSPSATAPATSADTASPSTPASAGPSSTTSLEGGTSTTVPTSSAPFPAGTRSAELVFTGDIIPETQVGRLARHYAQGTSA